MTVIKDVGFIGGGQLAMMLADSGSRLGLTTHALVPNLDCPAHINARLIEGDYHKQHAIDQLVECVDCVSFEFENVELTPLENHVGHVHIYPSTEAVKVAQDRALEKQYFVEHGIETAPFMVVENQVELETAVHGMTLPVVVKTCRFGYDGKGQCVVKKPEDLNGLYQKLGNRRLIVEGWINFDRELSLIAVRSHDGDMTYYPLTENTHIEGILHLSRPINDPSLQEMANQQVTALMEDMDYVGVLTVEFFQVGNRLIANEMAPRVHNSGHWTIEGAVTSQFENHMRAISHLELGPTDVSQHVAMVNIVGDFPDMKDMDGHEEINIHDYHKEPRPGRKLGHVTVVSQDEAVFQSSLDAVLTRLSR